MSDHSTNQYLNSLLQSERVVDRGLGKEKGAEGGEPVVKSRNAQIMQAEEYSGYQAQGSFKFSDSNEE